MCKKIISTKVDFLKKKEYGVASNTSLAQILFNENFKRFGIEEKKEVS